MRIAVFSAKPFERLYMAQENQNAGHELHFIEARLTEETADLALGYEAVALFSTDHATGPVLEHLAEHGTKLIALRSAGFNHVDLRAADQLGLTVLRVPAYSPHAIAEHAVGLMLTLNRKFHRAYNRVREQNFNIEGLMGFDMHGKTVGVIGTGKIGQVLCSILKGFGCNILACDPTPSAECQAMGVAYVPIEELCKRSDIISINCPLTPATKHMINAETLAQMKPSVMLINTSRGAVIDTKALIEALKHRRIGSVGLDVYEQEDGLFFKDLSDQIIEDDVFMRLMTFPNVLITAHQGFFTHEACQGIARTTINNATEFEQGRPDEHNRVSLKNFA